jgi:tRNA(Ile)-lysidine synthase TilS/MesJ
MYDNGDDLALWKVSAIVDKRRDAVAVEKSDGGAGDLVGALLRHLNDRLEHKREAHGFEKKEQQPMDRIETLRAIAKGGGILAIAKTLVSENRSYGISEEEFVQFATEDAIRKFPDAKTPAAAFSRSFTATNADGLTLRRAHRIVRDEQFGTTAKADRSDSAYNELMRKAEAYREAHPELSISQSFEKIYCDRANVELAKRERIESAPR